MVRVQGKLKVPKLETDNRDIDYYLVRIKKLPGDKGLKMEND